MHGLWVSSPTPYISARCYIDAKQDQTADKKSHSTLEATAPARACAGLNFALKSISI